MSEPDVNEEFERAIHIAMVTLIANRNQNWTGKELREWLEGEGFRIVRAPKAE